MTRIKRRNWSERRAEESGQDPRICTRCGNYYEYKGEVCLKEGKLTVKYAAGQMARKCLERMIEHITGNAKEEEKTRKTNTTKAQYRPIHLFGVQDGRGNPVHGCTGL